jgi:hypothetical protein
MMTFPNEVDGKNGWKGETTLALQRLDTQRLEYAFVEEEVVFIDHAEAGSAR